MWNGEGLGNGGLQNLRADLLPRVEWVGTQRSITLVLLVSSEKGFQDDEKPHQGSGRRRLAPHARGSLDAR